MQDRTAEHLNREIRSESRQASSGGSGAREDGGEDQENRDPSAGATGNQYKRKEKRLPPTAPNGARRNQVTMTQKLKYRMLDEEEDDALNPMETEVGATKDEYD